MNGHRFDKTKILEYLGRKYYDYVGDEEYTIVYVGNKIFTEFNKFKKLDASLDRWGIHLSRNSTASLWFFCA